MYVSRTFRRLGYVYVSRISVCVDHLTKRMTLFAHAHHYHWCIVIAKPSNLIINIQFSACRDGEIGINIMSIRLCSQLTFRTVLVRAFM